MSDKVLNDKLLKLIESQDTLGMIVLVYAKGGTGPEGITCHSFADEGIERVPNIPEKLRVFADKWEAEHK